MFSPIHHTYGPHVDRAYLRRVLALSYAPWAYRRGRSIELLRSALEEKFHRALALFASGREALLALFYAIDLKPGEEVIVQGYTCVVVPNAVSAAGGVPVFADIDRETLNLDLQNIGQLITPRTRAIICQHTFGIPSETEKLRALCDERKLLLIEDCAHVLPDENGPKEIGYHGDALLLSFGRDKAISGITGGAILVKSSEIADRLREMEARAADLSWFAVVRLLEYAPRMRLIRSLLWCGLDKPILKLLGALRWIPPVVTPQEKKGRMSHLLHRIPNACAALALSSLRNLSALNRHRRELTAFFLQFGHEHGWPVPGGIRGDLPLQKFPLFVTDAQGKRRTLKCRNIHLDDGWTGCVVCPPSVDLPALGYEWGDDPEAEKACEQILSLPTHPTMTMEQAVFLAQKIDSILLRSRDIVSRSSGN